MEQRVYFVLAALVLVLAASAGTGQATKVIIDTPQLTNSTSPPIANPDATPTRGYWNYTENGEWCILVAAGIKITFLYEGADGEDHQVSYDIPANNTIESAESINLDGSFCNPFDADTQRLRNRLRIHFFDDDWILELDFFYDYDPVDGDREWYMADIDLYYTYNNVYFPELADDVDERQQATLDRIVFFFTDLRESYWCDSKVSTADDATNKFQFYPEGGDGTGNPVVPKRLTVSAWNTRMEAFARNPDPEFHTPNRCVADQFIPRLVPGIIGGICAASIITAITIYAFQRKAKDRDYGSGMYMDALDIKEENDDS